MGLNIVAVMGRMVRDAEVKTFDSGSRKAMFTIAVDGGKDHTDFIMCEAWNGTADMVQNWFGKGRMIALYGRLSVEQYEKDGQKKSITKVVATSVSFCGDKRTSDDDGAGWVHDAEVAEDLPF